MNDASDLLSSLSVVSPDSLETRISCRAFQEEPVETEKLTRLREEMEYINHATGLSFQLYGNGEGNLELSARMFVGQPPCYIACVGPDDALGKEQVGYYGEHLVLMATDLGLGTCWVAGTFNRETVEARVEEGQFLHDVIPLGYAPQKIPFKVRTIRRTIRKRNRELSSFLPHSSWDGSPEWVRAGIRAVVLAPSAVNGQPVNFRLDGEVIKAYLYKHKLGLEETDLGIAKYNFALAAKAAGHPGTWEWGDGGAFL